jgi:hypothetical protein
MDIFSPRPAAARDGSQSGSGRGRDFICEGGVGRTDIIFEMQESAEEKERAGVEEEEQQQQQEQESKNERLRRREEGTFSKVLSI